MPSDEPFADFQNTDWKTIKGHLVAAVSEFVGTTMFLYFAFAGTQAAALDGTTATSLDGLLFISLSFGFSLMITVWAHYRISGGLFNPAVTLALAVTNNVPWVRSLCLLPAQFLGGIAASAMAQALTGPLVVVTKMAPGVTVLQGTCIEALGTFLLIFVILMLAAEKHETTPLAPVGIGITLFVAELGCVVYTGGSLNPARAFGPSLIDGDFPDYHYIYWVGPTLGALLASGYYAANRSLKYWEVNEGQDSRGVQLE